MSNQDPRQPSQGPEVNDSLAKEAYVKPALRFERVFETNALSCGKVQESELQCHTSRKLS
jgi:hypothetical protein